MSWTSESFGHMPVKISIWRVYFAWDAYHRSNIWMRYGIKLVELQLIIRTDIDVCALIFGAVAVFGRRED
jgi:hypothetical protein